MELLRLAFFLGTKKVKSQFIRPGVRNDDFFRDKPLGKNQFTPRFKALRNANGVFGYGFALNVTGHSARKTMIQGLTEAGHSLASIAKRTGHRNVHTIQNYTLNSGWEGVQ